MTGEEAKSCIGTIEMLQRLAYNIHGVMDVIDADNCKKIIKALEQKPCEDAVSKKDVLSEIIRFSTEEGASVECQQLYCDVNNMPPLTPIRPKGHWIYDKSIANWICSKCGETPKTIGYVGTGAFMAEHFKYCNHCGAEMEGSEEI